MDNIYQEELMFHYKNPSNRGKLQGQSLETIANNPFCGDEIKMQLKIKNGIVEDVAYDGDACAVAIASSSILTDEIKGKLIEEVKKITKEDLLELIGVKLTTSRVKCAMLPLEAVESLLSKYEKN